MPKLDVLSIHRKRRVRNVAVTRPLTPPDPKNMMCVKLFKLEKSSDSSLHKPCRSLKNSFVKLLSMLFTKYFYLETC